MFSSSCIEQRCRVVIPWVCCMLLQPCRSTPQHSAAVDSLFFAILHGEQCCRSIHTLLIFWNHFFFINAYILILDYLPNWERHGMLISEARFTSQSIEWTTFGTSWIAIYPVSCLNEKHIVAHLPPFSSFDSIRITECTSTRNILLNRQYRLHLWIRHVVLRWAAVQPHYFRCLQRYQTLIGPSMSLHSRSLSDRYRVIDPTLLSIKWAPKNQGGESVQFVCSVIKAWLVISSSL